MIVTVENWYVIFISNSIHFRRKRHFLKQDLNVLLAQEGIDSAMLMPKKQLSGNNNPVHLNKDPHDPAPFPPYLPLEVFDNEEYDCRTPLDWLAMGMSTGGDQEVAERKPVPGRAFLPTRDDVHDCKLIATSLLLFNLFVN